jgi:hypothetical protein
MSMATIMEHHLLEITATEVPMSTTIAAAAT